MEYPSFDAPPFGLYEYTETYNAFPIFDVPAAEILSLPTQNNSIHDQMLQPGQQPLMAPYPSGLPHSGQLPSDSHDGNTPSLMGPPAKQRKRKAPTLRADAWEPYKDHVIRLHINEGKSLPEVKEIMEREFHFKAEIRQYRTRITQWGLDKNVKSKEMQAIVRKRERRKLAIAEDNKVGELAFWVRDQKVEAEKIDRWMKRNETLETSTNALSPAASTPSAVFCRTVSDRGSPAPSPALSARSPGFSIAGTPTIGHSPRPPSPALSLSAMVHSASTFTGQSPAPLSPTIPSFVGNFTSQQDPPTMFLDEVTSPVPAALADPAETQTRERPTRSAHGRYKQAEELQLREELSLLELMHGKDHPETLSTLSELGVVLVEQGRFKSAEEILQRVVIARQKSNGYNDIRTLQALDSLGWVWLRQGRYLEAMKIHRRTFERMKDALGAEHPSTLNSMRDLARACIRQGKWKEAENLELSLIEIARRVLGQEHPNTLLAMGQLAETYTNQGRWKEAEELTLQTSEIMTRVLGQEDSCTLATMTLLTDIYIFQGKLKEAEDLGLHVIKMTTRVMGKEHPDTLVSISQLTPVWNAQGKWKEAEDLGLQLIEVMTRVLGQEHKSTLRAMNALTETYKRQGKLKEAEDLGLQVVEMMTRAVGQEHPHTLLTMSHLAAVYISRGKWMEAEELRRKIYEIRQEAQTT